MKQTLRVNRPANFGSIVAALPVPGTESFALSFVKGELSTYGMGSQLAEWLISQEATGEKTAAIIGKACQKHLASFGLMPASPGYQSIRKDKNQSGMVLASARCCQKVEQAASRLLAPVKVDSTDNSTDNSTDKPTVTKLDDKGKARTALGDIKASGITGKAELARIFASMQQAVVEEDLDKLSLLILEGQKILAIAK